MHLHRGSRRSRARELELGVRADEGGHGERRALHDRSRSLRLSSLLLRTSAGARIRARTSIPRVSASASALLLRPHAIQAHLGAALAALRPKGALAVPRGLSGIATTAGVDEARGGRGPRRAGGVGVDGDDAADLAATAADAGLRAADGVGAHVGALDDHAA